MTDIKFDKEFDARDMNCPMPLVKARREVGALDKGQVLKVVATDRGSVKDFQGWAQVSKTIQLLGQDTREEKGRNIYIHFIKRIE